jgi:hypothetical protein
MGTSPYGMTSGYNYTYSPTVPKPVVSPFAAVAPTPASLNTGNYTTSTADQAAYQQRLAEQQRLAAAQAAARSITGTTDYATQTRNASLNNPGGSGYQSGSTRTQPPQGDVMDGFARRYGPLEVDTVLSDPTLISQDLFGGQGRGALAGDASRYAAMAPLLFKMLTGGNMQAATNENLINYTAKMIGDMSSPGGRTATQSQLLNQLYAGLNDQGSEYGANLYGAGGTSAMTTPQEVKYINDLLGYTGTFTNYGTAQAEQKLADRLGQEYALAKAKGNMDGVTYAQYIQDNFLR